ncbi:hypothetical protein Cgig2_005949 [Carnegiea gigantea]|uniref:Uncharacterized protein n=1 Tax=Carnegiea gigantea TaxID=171969 RepID=A0A9Q1KJK2_9CARY|nr:hypothetical protein Cgig2_005949 [Carnegiea gigantea]
MPTVEEMLKNMLEQQQVMTNRMEEQNRKIIEQQELLGKMATRFDSLEKGNFETPHSRSVIWKKGEISSKDDDVDSGGNKHALHFYPKVEFPTFDGSNARNWIKKCQEETMQAMKNQDKPTKTFTQAPSSKPFLPNQKPLLPTPSRVPFTSTTNTNQNSNTKHFPRFTLAAEKAEKIAKGLCYYYDKPFDKGHKCATTATQLFLVEVPGVDV